MAKRTDFYRTDCRRFSGYKPCKPGQTTCRGCRDYSATGTRILIINLDSMGDVLRSTAILPALKRAHPLSHLTWVTLPRAAALLRHNPLIDRLLTVDAELPFVLGCLTFDLAFNVDKGLASGSIMAVAQAPVKRGFGADAKGIIIPLNPEADELYRIGLDDDLKFFVNQKSENQLLAEAFGLEYRRDEYVLELSPDELASRDRARVDFGLQNAPVVVGINTGCSQLFPYKKLPLPFLRDLIVRLRAARPEWPVLLLGGHEDAARNQQLTAELGQAVLATPTDEGLRRGLVYTDLADLVFSGDTLGLHMAIALKKRIVVWFGLTCETEIELYDRGEKLLAKVGCRPCWKRECAEPVKCYETVDLEEILGALIRQGNLVKKKVGGRRAASSHP